MKFLKVLFGTALTAVVVLVWEIPQINQLVYGDYETTVSVDKPEKIMLALSDAAERVKSKGFILSEVKITHPMNKDNVFIVMRRGVDRKAFTDQYGNK